MGKTYSGIIRYSSLKDATRIFKAVFSAFITITAFDTIYFLTYNSHVFVLMQIFFSTLLICFTLVSFRIFIKTLFKYFTGAEEQKKAKNIVIIGVNSTTIALGEALVNDSSTYKLRFFIDKNKYLNDIFYLCQSCFLSRYEMNEEIIKSLKESIHWQRVELKEE